MNCCWPDTEWDGRQIARFDRGLFGGNFHTSQHAAAHTPGVDVVFPMVMTTLWV
jgi:hypothetical protein